VISIQNGSDIYIDDVAVPQRLLLARDAVAHHLINAGTDGAGKVDDWAFVSQGSAGGTVVLGPSFSGIVEFLGADTRLYHRF
jgi:hypothetical protein